MSSALRLVALLLAVGLASPVAQAQRAVSVGENDAVAKTDRDYTSGLRLSVVYDDFSRNILAGQTFDFLKPGLVTAGAPNGPKRGQLEWIYLGQSIFAPDHTTLPVRRPGDRPFAGWLYVGVTLAEETARRQLDSFQFLTGVVGPAALANEAQSFFHRLLGQHAPVIAGYEIRNEPGLLVAWDRRWKFGIECGNGYGVDIIPAVGLTAGNVFTYGSAGMVARFGRALSTTWGPTLVRPAPSGASFISPDPGAPLWGFDFFIGAEARAIARNIFLDGNTFSPSPSVTKKPLVLDLIAGAEVFTQSGYQLAFTIIQRSREYSTQAKSATFGSISGSFRF